MRQGHWQPVESLFGHRGGERTSIRSQLHDDAEKFSFCQKGRILGFFIISSFPLGRVAELSVDECIKYTRY